MDRDRRPVDRACRLVACSGGRQRPPPRSWPCRRRAGAAAGTEWGGAWAAPPVPAARRSRAGRARWRRRPARPGLPAVRATTPYDGPVRAALVAYKDEGRRDLGGVLAPAARRGTGPGRTLATRAWPRLLATGNEPLLVVPVPSAAAAVRRRGDAPLRLLVDAALPLSSAPGRGMWVAPALALRRRVADQAGLDSRQRAANLEGAMQVTPRWRTAVAGRCCLLVDDVLTTGATLVEAARALRVGGARHVSAVVVAATQRRHAPPDGGSLASRADIGPARAASA